VDLATRQSASEAILNLIEKQPRSFGDHLVQSIDSWLDHRAAETASLSDQREVALRSQQIRLINQVLVALIKARPETSSSPKHPADSLLLQTMLLSHHPYLGSSASQVWLDTAVTAGRDPALIAQSEMTEITAKIRQTLQDEHATTARKQAGLRALSTVVFIAPHHYIPAIVQEVTVDLDPTSLDFIGEFELGVWQTPADETFVDVLSQKKDAALNKNSKNYAQDKWDQEVRDSIAKKKAGGTLSKQDQALVTAQVAKEAAVREQMQQLQEKLGRTLSVIRALLNGRTDTFDNHLPQILSVVIATAIGPAAFLVGEEACALYLVSFSSDFVATYPHPLTVPVTEIGSKCSL
jgi:hypothetical protein